MTIPAMNTLGFRTFWFMLLFALTSGNIYAEHYLCHSATCANEGVKIINSLNLSVDPCDDFYQYACGGTFDTNYYDKILLIEKKVLLEEEIQPDDDEGVVKIKEIYRSCMDTATLNQKGLAPLRDVIEDFGGWPLFMTEEEQIRANLSWTKIYRDYVIRTGEQSIFDVKTSSELYQADDGTIKNLIELDKINYHYGLPRPSWLYKTPRLYENFLKDIMQNYIADELPYNIDEELEKVFDLRNSMDRIAIVAQSLADKHIDPSQIMTIAELQHWYDNALTPSPTGKIDWLALFQAVFKGIYGYVITPQSKIRLNYEDQFVALATLLNNTDEMTIVNHIHLFFFEKHLKHTDEKTYNMMQNVANTYNPKPRRPPQTPEELAFNELARSKFCSFVAGDFGLALIMGNMYSRKHISSSLRSNASIVFYNAKQALRKHIQQLRIHDEITGTELLDKLDQMLSDIGDFRYNMENRRVYDYYKDVVGGSDFLTSVLSMEKHYSKKMLSFFLPNSSHWEPDGWAKNPYYDSNANVIGIPAVALQQPNFDESWTEELNYGRLGWKLGRVLSYIFNSTIYTVHGDPVNILNDQYPQVYGYKYKCLQNMYTRNWYTSHPPHVRQVDIVSTIVEAVVDTVGLQLAYESYKIEVDDGPQNKLIHLESFTPEQTFFLAYATGQCSKSPLRKFVVNGPLSNTPEFSEAFKCRTGTRMNPARKCKVWP